MTPAYSSSSDPETWVVGEIKELTTKGGSNIKYNIKNKIGGGASSLVFLADELTDKENIKREVVLKVLKRDVGEVFVEGLSIEESVLRDLYESLLKHGVKNPYIVNFYNSSPKNAEVRYIAMEFAKGKEIAALVGQEQNVLPQVKDLRAVVEKAQFQIQESVEKINPTSPFGRLVEEITSQFQVIQDKIQILQKQALAGSSRTGFGELEILEVFVQAARVTQSLNDDTRRSFRDFQLKNFYYDKENRQLKIIDWNVVTEHKELNPQKDIFLIAASLFYLFSRVSLEKPVNPAMFSGVAGEGWFVGASLLLQMALERVLIDQQGQITYTKAYDWSASEGRLQPVSTMESFGNALEMIIRSNNTDPSELVVAAERFAKEGKLRDAEAILQCVDQKISSGATLIHSIERKMKEIRSGLQGGKYTLMDSISSIKLALNSMNRDAAVQEVQKAIAEKPDSLPARRWQIVVDSIRDKPRKDFEDLWKGGQIQSAMLALENHLWDRAAEGFKDALAANSPLVKDALLNKDIEKLAYIFSLAVNDRTESRIQAFLQAYESVDEKVNSGILPHAGLILAEWSEWHLWRLRVEQLRLERNELEQLRSRIRSLAH